MELNIVLVEPQIPQNTGNIARTCAATGARLHLIEPMAFAIDDNKLKRAGLDYWYLLDVSRYACFDDFLQKNSGRFFFFTTKAKKTYTDAVFTGVCYIFFGREDAGLPETMLAGGLGENLRIPMIDEARSLNLSNAVAIAAFEAFRQNDFAGLRRISPLGL